MIQELSDEEPRKEMADNGYFSINEANRVMHVTQQALDVAFYLVNTRNTNYGLGKVMDIVSHIIPSACSYNTGYWPLYTSAKGDCPCFCTKFRLACHHTSLPNNWMNMQPLSEGYERKFSYSDTFKIKPLSLFARIITNSPQRTIGCEIIMDVESRKHVSIHNELARCYMTMKMERIPKIYPDAFQCSKEPLKPYNFYAFETSFPWLAIENDHNSTYNVSYTSYSYKPLNFAVSITEPIPILPTYNIRDKVAWANNLTTYRCKISNAIAFQSPVYKHDFSKPGLFFRTGFANTCPFFCTPANYVYGDDTAFKPDAMRNDVERYPGSYMPLNFYEENYEGSHSRNQPLPHQPYFHYSPWAQEKLLRGESLMRNLKLYNDITPRPIAETWNESHYSYYFHL